jgi:outer membrane protein assembly factor BamB
MPERWSRRAVVSSLCAVGLAGCGTLDSTDEQSTATTPTATPDTPARPDAIHGEWRCPRYDAGKSSYTPESTGPTDPVEDLWREPTERAPSPPVVADETVYIGGYEGIVRAIDITTGTERWQQQVGSATETPRVVDNLLYVPTDETVIALSTEDGTEEWRGETPDRADLVVADHGLYYIEDSSTANESRPRPVVVALEHSGERRWQTPIEDPWSPPLFARADRLFVSTDSHSPMPWELGVDDGTVLNESHPERGADFAAERFYRDGRIVAIDGFFGNLHVRQVAEGEGGWSADIGNGGSYAVSGRGETVSVLHDAYDDGVRLLSRSSPSEHTDWEVDDVTAGIQPPVVTDDAVFVGSEREIRCFDAADGRSLWRVFAEESWGGFVVVDDIVVATDGSTVRALRPT